MYRGVSFQLAIFGLGKLEAYPTFAPRREPRITTRNVVPLSPARRARLCRSALGLTDVGVRPTGLWLKNP